MKKAAVDREKQRRKKDRALEAVIQQSEEKSGKRLGEEDLMDIDQEGGSGRATRNSKRAPGTFAGLGGMGRRLG